MKMYISTKISDVTLDQICTAFPKPPLFGASMGARSDLEEAEISALPLGQLSDHPAFSVCFSKAPQS